VFDRVSSSHLEDDEPQQSLYDTNIVQLVELREEDIMEQQQMYKMIAANILCKHIPAFGFLKDLRNQWLPILHLIHMTHWQK
jgi:hypothetical protein